jgi:hypothetical protein
MTVRAVLSALALAFAAYQAARGILWTTPPTMPWLLIAALALYIAATLICIFAVPPQGSTGESQSEPMPTWAAASMLVVAATIPTMTGLAVADPTTRTATYGTWYVGGLGALAVVVMVRRRTWLAWIGTALLSVGAMVWLGPLEAFGQGLVGSIVWVGIAHLLVVLIDRAERDADQLVELQSVTSAWEAAQEGRERERRVQLQRALAVGGPILARVIAMHGALTDEERREAGIAEARLRDELRGPRLLDDDVRAAIDAARRRGAQVSVFDEGGLEGIPEANVAIIRAELAEALNGSTSNRIIIRTSPDERVAVTVVGRFVVEDTGEESVDLWREIRHPGR